VPLRIEKDGDREVAVYAELDPRPSQAAKLAGRLVLGIVLGLIVGCLAVLLMHYVDTTFRNDDDAARLLGCPILGGIPRSDVEIVEEVIVLPDRNEPGTPLA
jgi:capsular polysaccharide biosynthesis protein